MALDVCMLLKIIVASSFCLSHARLQEDCAVSPGNAAGSGLLQLHRHDERNADSWKQADSGSLCLDFHELVKTIDKSDHNVVPDVKCSQGNQLLRSCSRVMRGSEVVSNFFVNKEDFAVSRANFVFVHIPKVGGTSVETMFQDHLQTSHEHFFLPRCWSMLSFASHVHGSSRKSKKPFFAYGPRSFGVHEVLGDRFPTAYVTWFRDPVKRATSAYHYIKSLESKDHAMTAHHLFYEAVWQASDLKSYLLGLLEGKYAAPPEFGNHAVRLLNWGRYPEIDASIWDTSADVDKTGHLPLVDEKHYLAAKDTLRSKMAFVGITERWQDSQDMLCCMMDWKCGRIVRENINRHPDPSEEEVQLLQSLLDWDIKLYQDALDVFEEQKKEYSKHPTGAGVCLHRKPFIMLQNSSSLH